MKTSILSMVAATSIMLASSAIASPFVLTAGPGFTSGDLIGTIKFSGSPKIQENAYIGPLNMTVTDVATNISFDQSMYCTDIFDNFVSGGTYTTSFANLVSRIGAIKTDQINALLFHAVVSDAPSGAALQAAIWEIENEPGTAGYNITNGLFTISNVPNSTFFTDVMAYLTNINTGLWTLSSTKAVDEYVVIAGGSSNQSFGFLTTAPKGDTNVPAPGMLSVFGLSLAWLVGFRNKS